MGVKKPVATGIPSLEEIESSASVVVDKLHVTLSFDLSTRSVGWALGSEGELVMYGKYVFKTTANMGEKLVAFDALIQSLISTYEPTTLVLERPDPRGKTRSHFELLGVLRMNWSKYINAEIPKTNLIASRTVKKHLHVDPGKNHTENKRRMVEKINQMFSLQLQFDKNSAYKSDDDIADAIAVLVTSWRLNGLNA